MTTSKSATARKRPPAPPGIRQVRYSYLPQQFAAPDEILAQIKALVQSGDFTLGAPVQEFERRFADLIGVKHAIGVGSGTDALKLPLRAVGVGHGDEVITTANTFIATVGAIAETGARPVFVDCNETFCMDVTQVEAAITPRTKAIMPVHFTGQAVDMAPLMQIARKHGLKVVEDSCQGILAEIDGRRTGTWGDAGGFSLHPLKNLNVWGDGGIVVTNDDAVAERLRLLRNHGLKNRDEIEILGYNSRLDSLQAIVGNWLIGQTHDITNGRIANAAYYDRHFARMPELRLPPRLPNMKQVYHLYIVFAEQRDALLQYCVARGIEAKVHYPIPLYLQNGLKQFGYKAGDFPVTDRHAREIITFPVDQHLSCEEQDYVISTVGDFYASR